jgi:hypothetical protein
MIDVAIVHSCEIRSRVYLLARRLRALGLSLRVNQASERGASKLQRDNFDGAHAVVICWSAGALQAEPLVALAQDPSLLRKLVGCRLAPCALPSFGEAFLAADLQEWMGSADSPLWLRLVARLAEILDRRGLIELAHAQASGDDQMIYEFAKRFPDEPAAERIWAAREQQYRQELETVLSNARSSLEKRVFNERSKVDDALRLFATDFETWLNLERRGAGLRKPNLNTLFELWLDGGSRDPSFRRNLQASHETKVRAALDASPSVPADAEFGLDQHLKSVAAELESATEQAAALALQARSLVEKIAADLSWVRTEAPIAANAVSRVAKFLTAPRGGAFAVSTAGVVLTLALCAIGAGLSLKWEWTNPAVVTTDDLPNSLRLALGDQRRSAVVRLVTQEAGDDVLKALVETQDSKIRKLVLQSDRPPVSAHSTESHSPEVIPFSPPVAGATLPAQKGESNVLPSDDAHAISTSISSPQGANATETPSPKTAAVAELDTTRLVLMKTDGMQLLAQDSPSAVSTNSSAEAHVIAPAPSEIASFRMFDNYDLVSHDATKLQNIDLQACDSACGRRANCKAYTFDKWNRACYLKRDIGSFKLNPRSVTGLRNDASGPSPPSGKVEMEKYRAKTFPGSGYRFMNVDQTVECEQFCRADNACVAYTFHFNNRMCRLFDSTGEYFSDRLADSGGKRQD